MEIINKTITTTIEVPAGAKILNIIQENDIVMIEFAPKFKEGDFLYSHAYDQETILIFKKIYNNRLYYYVSMENSNSLNLCELNYWINIDDFRLATEVEKQQLLYIMKKNGKQWNAEKLRIEDIPQPKFKKGDKVRIKKGISSKTNDNVDLSFAEGMDILIGKTMTVDRYTYCNNYVKCEEICWSFLEEWLEPYEELKEGDLVIFWDKDKKLARIRLYNEYIGGKHYDNTGWYWENAIKFESKEQFEKLLKGEI